MSGSGLPQIFWDAFRKRWRARLAGWGPLSAPLSGQVRTQAWTEVLKSAGEQACRDLADAHGVPCSVGRERHGRLDVFAAVPGQVRLLVAFESELAYWGYNGASGKDWRQEFPKLCRVDACLRVLSSTFKAGTGASFPAFLRGRLDSMAADFRTASPGAWCLIFGPEDTRRDPHQPWLAYSLELDFSLRLLRSEVPLRPRQVIEGREPAVEA